MTASMLEGFKMVVACYGRVSSCHQKEDGQRDEIQKWLDGNGIDPKHVGWYADKETGTMLKRPEFGRLQRDIFSGKAKTVVLWKLDRLSRRLKDGVNVLADWCDPGLTIVDHQASGPKNHCTLRVYCIVKERSCDADPVCFSRSWRAFDVAAVASKRNGQMATITLGVHRERRVVAWC